MSSLIVIEGAAPGRRHEIHARTRIGRAPDNDIVLNDHLVSRYHAEVLSEGGQVRLRDLGSKNGFTLNGEKTTGATLQPEDQVAIGATLFRFAEGSRIQAARLSEGEVALDPAAVIHWEPFETAATGGDPAESLLRVAGDLLEGEAEDLPETMSALLRELLDLFEAGRGALLLRGGPDELVPLVVIGDATPLGLDAAGCFVLMKQGAIGLGRREKGPERGGSVLLAPLLRRRRAFGAVVLERPAGAPAFSPESARRLQHLARLIAGVVHAGVRMEQMVISHPVPSAQPYIGQTESSLHVIEQIRKVAAAHSTVLLTGETGTGKELVAHAIHEASPRSDHPFIAVDCSSIPENLVESELFGHEAGAFTGADRLKRGKVEMAEGGTLFLDEIGEMQLDLQPKLLRFLEERQFFRVGGVRPISADVRIIAATNRNLERATGQGHFREDLLFRLRVMPIALPPLRERIDDITLLVEHFAPRLATRLGKPYLGLLEETWALLRRYPWPGNVRELRHALERALILTDDGILGPAHFQLSMPPREPVEATTDGQMTTGRFVGEETQGALTPHPPTMAQAEAEAIARALRFAGGNRSQAAELLKIHRNTLTRKIQEYGIDIE